MTTAPTAIIELDPSGRPYTPYGAAEKLFYDRSKEVLLAGPAGTGKSMASLNKVYLCASKYPGMRALFARKTRKSMTQSVMVSFEEKVLPAKSRVKFHGQDNEYRFPNGSTVVVAGLDDPEKIKSSEYDMAYINEATEVSKTDLEMVKPRLRNWVMPYQQLLADCNPVHPTHWLRMRYLDGPMVMYESRHEDNPALYNRETHEWTPEGLDYIATLDQLTGVRKLRMRYGIWAAQEGIVYESWSDDTYVRDEAQLKAAGILNAAGRINRDKVRRVVAGVDWGFTNPGVITVWAIDSDGRLYLVRELYMSQRTINWWLAKAVALDKEFLIEDWICDPAEPMFIEQFREAGLHAVEAPNEIAAGVSAVQERLKIPADELPRLVLMRDALEERDPVLEGASKPCGLIEEFPAYVWAEAVDGKPAKEIPVDDNNHSLDTLRYVIFYIDGPVIDGHLAYVREQNRLRREAQAALEAANAKQPVGVAA